MKNTQSIERNLINKLQIEEIYNKIKNNKRAQKSLEDFQFEYSDEKSTQENRLEIVHYFENMQK